MDIASLAALCVLHLQAPAIYPLPPGQPCPNHTEGRLGAGDLTVALTSSNATDAISRVAYAEAGNQGDSGLAGVVYTILNRLDDGRWGRTLDAVLNAPHQFEPVSRVGGDWRALPPVSDAKRARVETIINLALDGRLPDLTGGARFFQNPRIVKDRARAQTVSPDLVNFGGATPTAVIGAHSFFAEAQVHRVGGGGGTGPRRSSATDDNSRRRRSGGGDILVAPSASEQSRAQDPAAGLQKPLETASAVPVRRVSNSILIATDDLLIRP
jgi:hypothetical protein